MRIDKGAVAVGCALAVGVSAWSGAAAAQPISDCYFDMGRMVDAQPLAGTKRATSETTNGLNYLQYLPKGHDASKKWPVIVFMHGSGEINAAGNMLNNLTKHSLPRLVEDPAWNWPFIVIAPQIDNAGWLSHSAQIGATLDKVVQTYGGDPNRIYLTGLSYGGVGTYAVGIALAERVAALMPVTPGGTVANWDQRAKITGKPIWLFVGTKDNEYTKNSNLVGELEASGASAFFKYTYAFADEYKDVVPAQTLTSKHVFGSYTDIGHDVWHGTFGVYCPTLKSYKTTQFQWLLSQSLDGSAFVDPRGTGGAGGAGGMTGTGGAAGSGGAGGAGGSPAGSAGSGGTGGATAIAGASGTPASAGSNAAGAPGVAGNASFPSQPSDQDGGCSFGVGKPSSSGMLGFGLLGLLGLFGRRRRRG